MLNRNKNWLYKWNKTRKKGFTLVELLAVIVILGILSLIATPFILGVVESAKRGAAVDSTYGYIDAIEKSSLQEMIDKGEYVTKKDGTYSAETIKPVKYKGTDPKDVCVNIEKGEVYAGSFQFGKYVVDYKDGKAVINDEKTEAGCGGNSETPGEDPKDSDDLKEDTKVKNGENYYVGSNPNNWVIFGRADESDNTSLLMWRIVKIDKVGIKMVYEGIQNGEKIPLEDGRSLLNGTMGVAWNSNGSNYWKESDLKEKLSNWLSRIAVLNLNQYATNTTWNIGGVPDFNPTDLRTFLEYGNIDSENDTRKYQGVTDDTSKIGMLSPWDYMYTSSNEECSKSYTSAGTSNECSIDGNGNLNNFLYKNKYSYWTMNAVNSAANQAWNITNSGIIASRQANYSIYSVRPVLNLKLDTKFVSGDGSIENPYIVEQYLVNLFDKPEIKLNGEKEVVLYKGDSYVDAGATAVDAQDGDLTNKIKTESNLDTTKLGSYTITYNVTDSDGNKAIPVTRTVRVVDQDLPRITLNGTNPIYVTIGANYEEPGAIAIDPNYGDISASIQITGTVDTSTLGTYYLTYHVTNQDGLEAISVERRVIVKASVPKITLTGSNLVFVDVGTVYQEEGATATDSVFGDLTSQIETKITKYNENKKEWEAVTSINTSAFGNYKVHYSVTNEFGSNATAVRNVNVVSVTGPEITYTPNDNSSIQKGHSTTIKVKKRLYDINEKSQKYFTVNASSKTGLQYKTNEEFEKLFRNSYQNNDVLSISQGTGDYYFYAMAKDVYKDTTYKKSGLFKLDNSAPVIELKSGVSRVLIHTTYTDPGATALDEFYDGNLTSKIATENKVNTSKEGIYQVIYTVSDSAGNTTRKVRNITVYQPVPTIGLVGGSHIRVRYGSEYQEPGYTASDEIDGDLTNKVEVSGSVDTSKEGIYEITYQVTNSEGKKTIKVRTVEVYIPVPVITIKGENPTRIKVKSSYTDFGATASDELDGDLTSRITTTSNINTNLDGTYQVVYSVTNNLGKTSTATRTIIVYANEPMITLKGENPTILYKGGNYEEAGYTANDEADGDISNKVKVSGSVNTNKAGTYKLTYEVENNYGKKGKTIRTVIVRASEMKLILKGESTVTLLKGTQYVEAGYTATDEIDGDITSSVVIDLGGLNINKAGTYAVTYTATNRANDTYVVKRTVVIRNPIVEITLNGESTVEVPIGYPYSDLGATASDELLGDISSNIKVEHNINTNVLGTYKVTYTVTSSGVTTTKERTIKVVPLAGPMVTFETNGNGNYLKQNSTKVTISKNAYDIVNDSIKYQWTNSLTKPSEESFQESFKSGDTISTPENASGKHYLWVLAKDTYGNTSIIPSNSFNLDNTAPVLTLKGNKLVEVPADGEYKDAGVTVVETDSGLNEDGVVITSNVISGVIGTYQVIYTATDKVGNVAVPVKRTVSIIEASLKDAPGEGYVKKYDTSYFVGENPNNYVVFGNAAENEHDYIPILWRIIKANDEGIKIVYEGINEDGTIGSYSYDKTNNQYNRPADIVSVLNNFYQNLKEDDKESVTKAINWCVGATSSPYNIDAFRNDECKTLSTNKSAVGLMSGLDYLLTTEAACDAYNQASCGDKNFLRKNYSYYTMSSDAASSVSQFIVNNNGALTRTEVTNKQGIRPVVNLKDDVLIKGGEGTKEKPYQLNSRVPVQDTNAPTVEFSPNTATGNLDGVEVLVSDDITGVDNNSLKYLWTTNTTQPTVDKFVSTFSNGDKVLVPEQQAATYYLWILARDRKGNQSITRSGIYKIDNVGPVITINGDNPATARPGATYVDAGATAVDAIDGNVTVQVTTDVNPNVEGTYQVIYTAIDKTGNKTTAIRTVVVGYFEIRTPEDFYNIRNSPGADYKIMNDIDFTKSEWKDNFPVIDSFSGSIEGNNNKIVGLKINNGEGIFKSIFKGTDIRNLTFIGFENNSSAINNVGSIAGTSETGLVKLTNITLDSTSKISGGYAQVGGLIGQTNAVYEIDSCIMSGTVTGTNYDIGGIIGQTHSKGIITNSYVSGNIGTSATFGSRIGGIVGYNNGTIQQSYTTGSVTGTDGLGGIVGYNNTDGIIQQSYSTGIVKQAYPTGSSSSADSPAGGIAGYNYGTIQQSYTIATVTATRLAGGIVGENLNGQLNDVFFAGSVTSTGANPAGGLIGKVINSNTKIQNAYILGKINNGQSIIGSGTATVTNTYWIGETTGINNGVYGTIINSVAEALRKNNYIGFDFSTIWGIEEGSTTPYLKGLILPDQIYLKNIEHFPGEGKGTSVDPYQIKTVQDFYNIRISSGSSYKIMNDIDFTNSEWKDNFPVIDSFSGTIDGNNKKIIGLKISENGVFKSIYKGTDIRNLTFVGFENNSPTIDNVGSIAGTSEIGLVKLSNITIDSTSKIIGKSYVGGLIGRIKSNYEIDSCVVNGVVKGNGGYIGGVIGYSNISGVISNSSMNGSVSGLDKIGGIAGNNGGTIEQSYTSGSITGTSTEIGGISGYNTGTIRRVYSSGNVTGSSSNSFVGGLVGNNYRGVIQQGYVSGTIKGNSYVGGITGRNYSGSLADVSFIGTLTSTTKTSVGGLIGEGYSTGGSITNGYVLGKITNGEAIIGSGTVTASNTYWISETTGIYSGSNGTIIDNLNEAIKETTYSGFDFSTIWGMEEGSTPYLKGLMIPDQIYVKNITPYEGEGKGTSVDPYQITTANNFYSIRNRPNSYYKLMNDIDFTTSKWKDNFPMIESFSGTIEGNNKKIIGLRISGNGIFTRIYKGTDIRNLTFVGFENNSPTIDNVGAIAGTSETGLVKLTNVVIDSTSKITGKNYLGGLIGQTNSNYAIDSCVMNGTVNGTGFYVGGLVGRTYANGTITNSSMNGSVTGNSTTGGIVGNGAYGTIESSYTTGSISGTNSIGGIAGVNVGIIQKSYTTGNITASASESLVGGIAGFSSGTIEQVYSSSTVNGYTISGGIVGRGYGELNNVFFVGILKNRGTAATKRAGIVGEISSSTMKINNGYVLGQIQDGQPIVGSGSTTATNAYWISETTGLANSSYGTMIGTKVDAMQSSNYSGFDFSTIWAIEEGNSSPYLRGLLLPEQIYIGQ